VTLVDESDLRRIFRAELLDLPLMSVPGTTLAREGQEFRPPADSGASARATLWVREMLRPLNESRNASGLIQSSGQLIYAVYRPSAKFLEEGDALARAIAERFEAGRNVTVNDDGVHIDHCDRAPWIADANHPGWHFKAVTLLWRVHTLASI
jgi:hypothetical protein